MRSPGGRADRLRVRTSLDVKEHFVQEASCCRFAQEPMKSTSEPSSVCVMDCLQIQHTGGHGDTSVGTEQLGLVTSSSSDFHEVHIEFDLCGCRF